MLSSGMLLLTHYYTVVLPLQKLIHLHDDSDSDSDCSGEENPGVQKQPKGRKEKSFLSSLRKAVGSGRSKATQSKPFRSSGNMQAATNRYSHTATSSNAPHTTARTLQRFHGGPNEERIAFMEKYSALSSKNLGVSVEQVSIFLTADNTVISFFESSAEDIETPIITRLHAPETVLRRSSDASMLTQAIIDAIIE